MSVRNGIDYLVLLGKGRGGGGGAGVEGQNGLLSTQFVAGRYNQGVDT